MKNYKYEDLFLQDSVKKELKLTFSGGLVVTNENIFYESMQITESISSTEELRYGSCEAAMLKIKIANVNQSLVGQMVTVSMVLNGNSDEPFVFGTYKVHSDKKTADRKFKEIVAYDLMFDILNMEMAEWYNNLLPNTETVITIKQFYQSLYFYIQEKFGFGLVGAGIFVSEDYQITRYTDDEIESLKGKDVINALCEMMLAFGAIRNGEFNFIRLKNYSAGVYPSENLYPSNTLYPQAAHDVGKISRSNWISCTYEDYMASRIGNVVLIMRNGSGIKNIEGGNTNNIYRVSNILSRGMINQNDTIDFLEYFAQYTNGIKYRPSEIVAKGNPCLEPGDKIRVITKDDIVDTYLLNRTITGIQMLQDNYIADGVEAYNM